MKKQDPGILDFKDGSGTFKPVAFDFDNGDAITLEAWVKPASFTGQHVYIISKGRTESSGAKGINQNWALRLRKQKGLVLKKRHWLH